MQLKCYDFFKSVFAVVLNNFGTQELGGFTTLVEDLSLIPSIHIQ